MNKLEDNYQPDFYLNYDKDVAELDWNIHLDELRSKQYMEETIRNIKKFDRSYLTNPNLSKKYKIPFKLRFHNFINKFFNTIK